METTTRSSQSATRPCFRPNSSRTPRLKFTRAHRTACARRSRSKSARISWHSSSPETEAAVQTTMNPQSKKLAGKVAVVTGASKGIGAAIAKHLAAEGAAVVVNYASSKADAAKVVAEITGNGGKAFAVQADVAKRTEIERLFSETKKAFGTLDILVNNAGIYEFLALDRVTNEHFHKQFDLNVLGLLLTSQEAAKYL